jgi:SpoVK/Ycf46/Vps4 family AAA+-type ATPase
VDRSRDNPESPRAGAQAGRTKQAPALPAELAGILSMRHPGMVLRVMVLDAELAERLAQVISEQRLRLRLEEFGLKPMRKLLLIGTPGTSKTMRAAALAGELGLPLFTIQLAGLILRFLGETAAKLRLVFEGLAQQRGVYFFDEFDALGAERGDRQDVGEIRRVLNSFLQFLEQNSSASLVLAATNHGALLDRGLFCRFDSVLFCAIPAGAIAAKVIMARRGFLDCSAVDWQEATAHGSGLSHAELVLAREQAAKQTVLANRAMVHQRDLEEVLKQMRSRSVRG